MPNWVYNFVTVEGDRKDLLAFAEKAEGKDSKISDAEIVNAIHFGAFIHPTDEELPYYKGELTDEKPEGYEKLSSAEQMAHSLKFSGRGWYDWNIREWGTKWDACEQNFTDQMGAGMLDYSFSTAWSIPEPVFRAMVEQHPELSFKFSSREEQGWGAEYSGDEGELILMREWDIPSSHADYEAADDLDGCICAHSDNGEEWYGDCPRDVEFYAYVTKAYKFTDIADLDTLRALMLDFDPTNTTAEEVADYGSVRYTDEYGESL